MLSLSLAPLVGACGEGGDGGVGPGGTGTETGGTETGGTQIDTATFEAFPCASEGVAELAPAEAWEYISLRRAADDAGGAGGEEVASSGVPCATATDVEACEQAVQEASATNGFQLGECTEICDRFMLVLNRGDEVSVLSSVDAVKAWLAPVDTPSEAVMVAKMDGYSVSCDALDRGGFKEVSGGYEVLGTRYTSLCAPVERALFRLNVSAEGEVEELESQVISSESGVCIGRRPAGLAEERGRGSSRLGAYFAEVAQLEAASVHAFAVLREELSLHGAPQALLDQVDAAREDEVRHARIMKRVATRFGGVVRDPVVAPRAPRSLEEVAIENAAEGCVRETYGALVGMHQARFAQDRVVRGVMRQVARDEAAHASLAWAVDAWVRSRLSPEALARVEAARQQALAEVADEARAGYAEDLCAVAGMPGAEVGQRMAQAFAQAMPALAA
ncbi:putative lipoprotein [Chondromyces apiculatus DSM 436]|uniref:Putative lipoprotein n=1 Tax=Chondromyces apiculatus DSM 436 TaxID=1192034 RepID=A0A017T306_9BACT|nr:putative lipoprotein [Chondromyces apiculatus DSM 436]